MLNPSRKLANIDLITRIEPGVRIQFLEGVFIVGFERRITDIMVFSCIGPLGGQRLPCFVVLIEVTLVVVIVVLVIR